MKILVACDSYPDNNGNVAGMFFHVRIKYLYDQGHDVTVLHLGSVDSYEYEGIYVECLSSFEQKYMKHTYDILICHAPHLSTHYKFLIKYNAMFTAICFVLHGNEVLNYNRTVPQPYPYMKGKSNDRKMRRAIIDWIKLSSWRRFWEKYADKTYLFFVSQWMYDECMRWTRVKSELILKHSYVIYNAVGKEFEKAFYDVLVPKEFDFVTIRSNIDGSKYGVDIVVRLAIENPDCKFIIVGKGEYFSYYEKPNNLIWWDKTLPHKEVIQLLNKSKCGLMLTRHDAQGVMACEFATFGIPLITSDIPVCREVFSGFENVAFIDNNNPPRNILKIQQSLIENLPYEKNNSYFTEFTNAKEQKELEKIYKESNGNE